MRVKDILVQIMWIVNRQNFIDGRIWYKDVIIRKFTNVNHITKIRVYVKSG